MKRFTKYCLVLLLLMLVVSCAKPRPVKLPPVTEGWRKSSALKNAYIVQPKDTLYSISWSFGVDYRYLADINNLKPPFHLHSGQRLYIALSATPTRYKTEQQTYFNKTTNSKLLIGWYWPTDGKIVARYSNKMGGNKGVDVAGVYGNPIFSSNSGVVVYSGTGIRSYGKLIIIKHNDDYLSAYAYNKQVLVKEGQEIKARQKIAEMGYDNEGRACLHFEIRRFGKPENPLLYLPQKR